MALLDLFRGTDAEVSARPVSDGALLFATDTKKIYLDKGSNRIEMTFKQDLSDYVTDSELTELLAGKADTVHTHDAADVATGTFDAERIPTITDAKIASVSAEKITGTIPSENLPSYVDDVIEAKNYASLPPTGEAGKIYVDKETNKTYRWGGSAYVEISASLALGETSATAFRGDYGKVAYDHAQAKGSQFASGLYKVETNAEGHVVNATAVAKSDITALGIPSEDTDTTYTAGSGLTLSGTEFSIASKGVTADKIADGVIKTYDVATQSANGLMSSTDKKSLDDLTANAIKTDSSGYVQKFPIKFRSYEGGVEINLTGNTESSFGFDFKSASGSIMSMYADDVLGAKTSSLTLGGSATFSMGGKSVTGISDSVGSSPTGTNLVTDKAVKSAIESIDIPDSLPSGGTTGQVLTKTEDGEAWQDIPDYENATTEYDGLMSSADKKKLDGIATGAEVNQNAFTTVSANGTNVTANAKTDTLNIDAGNNVTISGVDGTNTITISATDTTYEDATTSSSGLMSAADKTKLNGIETGAEANQNAFATVSANGTSVAANTTTDTLKIAAGTNVTITGDDGTNTVTIAAKDTTYSNATTSTAGLMSSSDKTKLDGIATGADKTPSVIPVNRGGTGVTSEDALVQLVFNSSSTPHASETRYGVVKFASDSDFRAYMGLS